MYTMNHKEMGIFLIFNQIEFDPETKGRLKIHFNFELHK